MNVRPGPLPVREIEPVRQAAAERLAAILEQAGDGAFHAAIEHDSAPGCWLLSADGPGLRIDAVGGAPAALHAERVEQLVDALAALEPLLDRIEARTGWVIEPESTALVPPNDTLVVRIATDDGARFALAVPSAMVDAVADAPGASLDRLGTIPVPASLRAVAAHLTIDEAGALATGDLLVLAPGPWRATLAVAPMGEAAAMFDSVTGRLTRLGNLGAAANLGSVTMDDGEPGEIDRVRAFRVPIELRLPDAGATMAELAGLREGGTLALGAVTAGLQVELAVGGRRIASGEIVRLGDRFAVLVDRVADPEADGSPGPAADAELGGLA